MKNKFHEKETEFDNDWIEDTEPTEGCLTATLTGAVLWIIIILTVCS